ncbi:G protein pathway suppressor 2-like protein [Dinothrombium tinctorium]|uniref:G protein pathway suppressor 2-like protein n=1 Tax=Dinothrombium tinctorium TaxID=1965070 RepID=A0A3S3PMP4_9ACAR|nr:G protein pathway suppressor 2-like protein [Dinothrombium tinctorium]RWS05808.1 G protein pathway suppressor 2-like protein [Dinothrombium tinctorium]RWS05902.1 G protein pathway suppressor 2-like protein [Dinothrombium tinctorium]
MPAISIERPKMSVEMWESLKAHILRKRQKRKQEQEQDAELERHRREQELKRKRDATTLEDIKDQLSKLDVRLKELREEKHELFLQLKKVLNEDETRKRQKESELMSAHQVFAMQSQPISTYHPYYIPTTLMGTNRQQPSLYQRPTVSAVPVVSSLTNTSQSINTQQTIPISAHSNSSPVTAKRTPMKRPHERTPSPPPAVPYSGVLPVYKSPMSYTPSVPKANSGHYQLYYPPGAPQVAYDAKGNPYHILSGAAFPAESQAIEPNEYDASKYYQQFRGVNPLVPSGVASSIIPIQSSQTKPGGITSGFPVQRLTGPTNVAPSSSAPRDVRDANRQYHRYY